MVLDVLFLILLGPFGRAHTPGLDWLNMTCGSLQVPRVSRQVVLERLAGQHLALALHQAGRDVTAASLAECEQQTQEALAAAVAQEEELYQRGKASKAVSRRLPSREAGGCDDTLRTSSQTCRPPRRACTCPACHFCKSVVGTYMP